MTTENPTSVETDERRAYFLDIAIAVLLGIAAIATAWSAYQASMWGGDQLEFFNTSSVRTTEAALYTDQASQAWLEGTQLDVQDQALFFEYVKAAQAENTDLALYLRESLMSPDLISAIEWWEGTGEEVTTPFVEENPNWVNPSYDTAADLDAEAQILLDEAAAENEKANEKAGEVGDDYDFVTVILASSLFMLGIAGVFRQLPVKLGMGALGAVFLVVALVQLAGFDRA